jgi:flagellar assembly protein FliH
MSRLMRGSGSAVSDEPTSLGSFVLRRANAGFRARGSSDGLDSRVDIDMPPITPEQERLRARSDAYEQGLAEGRRTVEAEFAAERDALVRLVSALEVLKPEPTNALALLLAETVDRLVRDTVGEVEIDASRLLARARAAAALIGENVEPSKLRVHPDDISYLAPADLELTLEGDPSLPRGTLVLETGHGWIEDGPEIRLERLRAALDKMAAPQ